MDFYLQRALDAIDRETRGMTAKQLAWNRDGKWSTAQILEHLSLAFSSTSKLMERCVQQGRAEGKQASLRERLITLVVVGIGYFPTGREAPEWTRPRGLDPEKAVATIRAALADMEAKIAAAQAKFGDGVLAVHPIIGPLTARQWRKFHWEHTRHHMKQIRAIRAASSGQPAASA
jgi:DinB superfamily